MVNLNIKKDLTKLPISERLNLMMQYRTDIISGKKSFLSESEYCSIDASIKTNDEIRAYNSLNKKFTDLMHRADFLSKIYSSISSSLDFFNAVIISGYQVQTLSESFNFFLFLIQDRFKTNKQREFIEESINKAFKETYSLNFKLRITEEREDGDKHIYLDPYYCSGDSLEGRINKEIKSINEMVLFFEEQVKEYRRLQGEYNLHLKTFENKIEEYENSIKIRLDVILPLLPEEISNAIKITPEVAPE